MSAEIEGGGRKWMSEPVKMNIATVITLCLALCAGAWALSGEVHNYRLMNIRDRLKTHETAIMSNEKELVLIRTIQLDVVDTLKEIREDLRTLR